MAAADAPTIDSRASQVSGGPRAGQLRAVGTSFLRRRPVVVAPMMLGALGILHHHHAPAAQLRALGVSFSIVIGFFGYEAWRGGRRLVTARELGGSLFATLIVVAVACALTGGAGSPLLPLLSAPVVVTFAAFGGRTGVVMLATLGGVMALLWALPPDVPFPAVPPAAHRSIAALTVAGAGVLAWIGVTGLTDAYVDARATLDRAGDTLIESTEARAAALEALGATVAHELRNPLAAMKGLVELLIENADPARAAPRLGVVRGEVERMEAILDDYLSFSRPFGSFAPVSMDVAAAVREVTLLLEARAERDGVALVFVPGEVEAEDVATQRAEVGPGEGGAPPVVVQADPRRLKEAVLNLVLNALQATPPGGTVRVGARRAAGEVRVLVEDTGRGMSPETLARIGEAYFTARPDGVGLGVRLARQVAELHGGRLVHESTPSRGTCATLVFPARGDQISPMSAKAG